MAHVPYIRNEPIIMLFVAINFQTTCYQDYLDHMIVAKLGIARSDDIHCLELFKKYM